jgi:hypothetical protein
MLLPPEDAITVNQKSLDLGLFRSYQTSCVTLQEKKRGSMNTIERFGKPSRFTTLNMKSGSYEQLDRDGFPFPGTPINNNDVLIGRMLPINKTSPTANVHIAKLEVNGEGEGADSIDYDKMGFMCTSIMASQKTSGVVLDTIVTSDIHGMKKVKVRLLKTCVFILGDKASSRHGQKGVMGISRPSKEFPFTSKNHIPDLILNPQSIPSRMTVGHILEQFYGQALLYNRKRGDTTAFTHSYATSLDMAEMYAEELLASGAALGNADLSKLDVNDRMDTIARALRHKGHHASGNERMYNGKVGGTLEGEHSLVARFPLPPHTFPLRSRGLLRVLSVIHPMIPATVWGFGGKKKANEPRGGVARSAHGTHACDCLRFYPQLDRQDHGRRWEKRPRADVPGIHFLPKARTSRRRQAPCACTWTTPHPVQAACGGRSVSWRVSPGRDGTPGDHGPWLCRVFARAPRRAVGRM